MLRSRNAQVSAYTLSWIVFTTLMLVIIFGTLTLYLGNRINPKQDTFPADAAALEHELLYSPSGLAALDATGRAIPGVVDADKLRDPALSTRLTNAAWIAADSQTLAAKVTLGTTTTYYYEQFYRWLQPQVGGTGAGSTEQLVFPVAIIVRDKGIDTLTTGTIEVLRRASS
jgi:hypothetical protein